MDFGTCYPSNDPLGGIYDLLACSNTHLDVLSEQPELLPNQHPLGFPKFRHYAGKTCTK